MPGTALAVWTFGSTDGATTTAALLTERGVGPLDGATVVWARHRGKPRVRPLAPAEDDAPGSVLGSGFWDLVLGLTFYVPLLGAAVGAATGAVSASLADVGIPDGFLNRVRDRVTPGTSALFVLGPETVLAQARDAADEVGPGREIRTAISDEQEAALRLIFGE